MKIKDLTMDVDLVGLKVRTSCGKIGYWAGQWAKGVWLTKDSSIQGQITPVFVNSLDETLEWEVAEEFDEVKL